MMSKLEELELESRTRELPLIVEAGNENALLKEYSERRYKHRAPRYLAMLAGLPAESVPESASECVFRLTGYVEVCKKKLALALSALGNKLVLVVVRHLNGSGQALKKTPGNRVFRSYVLQGRSRLMQSIPGGARVARGAGLHSSWPDPAAEGSWQGVYCTLFITMEDEAELETNMEKMWNDRQRHG